MSRRMLTTSKRPRLMTLKIISKRGISAEKPSTLTKKSCSMERSKKEVQVKDCWQMRPELINKMLHKIIDMGRERPLPGKRKLQGLQSLIRMSLKRIMHRLGRPVRTRRLSSVMKNNSKRLKLKK